MIEVNRWALWKDGRKVHTREMTPSWAGRVWGRVLEVGLGMGILARGIIQNPNVTRHLIIEQDAEIIAACGSGLPAEFGTFPDDASGTWDCITLDVPYSHSYVPAALPLLADGGALFVRGM